MVKWLRVLLGSHEEENAATIGSLLRDVERGNAEREQLKESCEDSRNLLKVQEEISLELKKQVEKLLTENRSLEMKTKEFQAKLEQTRAEAGDMDRELVQARSEREQLRDELYDARKALEDAGERALEAQEKDRESGGLHEELRKAKLKIKELESGSKAKLKREVRALKGELEKLRKEK